MKKNLVEVFKHIELKHEKVDVTVKPGAIIAGDINGDEFTFSVYVGGQAFEGVELFSDKRILPRLSGIKTRLEKGRDYIVISELPEAQQAPLKKWLIGQTVPTIPGEGDCCYSGDYDHFFTYWKFGQEAPVTD
jgi:hypothetical protein